MDCTESIEEAIKKSLEKFVKDNETIDNLKVSLKNKDNLKNKRGIEEFLQPKLNAFLSKGFENNRELELVRIGTGKLTKDSSEKADLILEYKDKKMRKNIVLILELKIANTYNDLMFGYQSRSGKNKCIENKGTDWAKKLEKFKCCDGCKGKKKITDGYIYDIHKLLDIYFGTYTNKREKEKKDVYICVVGITKNKQECDIKNFLEEVIKESKKECFPNMEPVFKELSVKVNVKTIDGFDLLTTLIIHKYQCEAAFHL